MPGYHLTSSAGIGAARDGVLEGIEADKGPQRSKSHLVEEGEAKVDPSYSTTARQARQWPARKTCLGDDELYSEIEVATEVMDLHHRQPVDRTPRPW